jgi:PIN domain nuclease of toxin-antitoxin system
MKLLLDTHAFLWIMWDHNLSAAARQAYLNPVNDLYLSAVSYWEMCIKVGLGKLTVRPDWMHRFDTEITRNRIAWLAIAKEHCQRLLLLPALHRDPFDRLLIAQTQHEGMTLLTADANIQQYDVSTLW